MTKTAATTSQRSATTSVKSSTKTTAKTPAKPAPKVAAKKPAATPGKAVRLARPAAPTAPAASSAAAEPSMRFYYSKALRAKTLAILEALEAAPDDPRHGHAMADLATELLEAGMDYYFMRALKQAQVGFVAEQSARIGMAGAVKLISSVNRKFIMRMDKHQLLIVAQHVRELG